MTAYVGLVSEAREHVEKLASGTPDYMAARILSGESDEPHVSLIVKLANALEDTLQTNDTMVGLANKRAAMIRTAHTRLAAADQTAFADIAHARIRHALRQEARSILNGSMEVPDD